VNLKSILIVAGLVIGGAAIAQGGGAKPPAGGGQGNVRQGGGQGGFRMRTPEERVERMSKDLKLTADQKKKMLALYKSYAPKQKALFENQKMSRDQKMAAFRKMRDEMSAKVKTILTKDQMAKLEKMRQRGPGGPGGPGRGPGAGGGKTGGTKSGTTKGGAKSG
jgi:hypothetical protein